MGRGDYLGELEQVVMLAVARLEGGAYGMSVRREIESRARACGGDRRGVFHSRASRRQGLRPSVERDSGSSTDGRARRFFELTAPVWTRCRRRTTCNPACGPACGCAGPVVPDMPLPHAPRVARACLSALLPADARSSLLAELDHEYLTYVRPAAGRLPAHAWYWRQALASVLPAMAMRRRRRRRRIMDNASAGEQSCAGGSNRRYRTHDLDCDRSASAPGSPPRRSPRSRSASAPTRPSSASSMPSSCGRFRIRSRIG